MRNVRCIYLRYADRIVDILLIVYVVFRKRFVGVYAAFNGCFVNNALIGCSRDVCLFALERVREIAVIVNDVYLQRLFARRTAFVSYLRVNVDRRLARAAVLKIIGVYVVTRRFEVVVQR